MVKKMKKIDVLTKESLLYNLKTAALVVTDILLINIASLLALVVRFEFDFASLVESRFLDNIFMVAPINTMLTIVVFVVFKMYRGIWKYAGVDEFLAIASGCVTSTACVTIILFLNKYFFENNFPNSYPIIYFIFFDKDEENGENNTSGIKS